MGHRTKRHDVELRRYIGPITPNCTPHSMKPQYRILCLLSLALASCTALAAGANTKTTTLCGWCDNPTPQNVWLTDPIGEWQVSIQGGPSAQGDWPEFRDSQWVKTNGHYGYGCACMKAVVNRKKMQVTRIVSAHARPLSACRNDPKVKHLAH